MTEFPKDLIEKKAAYKQAHDNYFGHKGDGSIESDITSDLLCREMNRVEDIYSAALREFEDRAQVAQAGE